MALFGHSYQAAREANGPAEIRAAVREQLKNGANIVKLMATGGASTPGQHVEAVQLELDEIKAATDVAHSNFKLVGAHAHGAAGIKRLVQGGTDIVDHATFLDEESAKMMCDNGTFIVFTPGHESMFPEVDPAWTARVKPLRARNTQVVELAHKYGIRLCIGTDAGGGPYMPHGKFHVCLIQAVKDGMSALEVITAATSVAAQCIDLGDHVGTITAGKLADFTVYEGDPTANINDIADVFAVIKDGKVVAGC